MVDTGCGAVETKRLAMQEEDGTLPGLEPGEYAGQRILVGLSGGVDSSLAAVFCQQADAEVSCAYMKNWINEEQIIGDCPWREDVEYARAVAQQLELPFHVVNLTREYRERIVEYLLEGYRSGLTPNPDVFCNREMKFGVFLDWAKESGIHVVATGHYACRRQRSDASWELHEGVDGNKDQSYFLALLTQEQLAAARFPLGNLKKPDVRRLAAELELPTAKRKDSQGICFIGNVKMSDFLNTFISPRPGSIVDTDGRQLGEHSGLHLFTLGQRRGIGVASPVTNKAYVVVAKKAASNELVIALEEQNAPGLFASRCVVGSLSFINEPITEVMNLQARPRYRAMRARARVEPYSDGQLLVEFEQPQRALAPGQICALHEGSRVIGGAIFEDIL